MNVRFVRYISSIIVCFIGLYAVLIHAGDRELENVPAQADAKLVPDHDIQYEETLSPAWKENLSVVIVYSKVFPPEVSVHTLLASSFVKFGTSAALCFLHPVNSTAIENINIADNTTFLMRDLHVIFLIFQ